MKVAVVDATADAYFQVAQAQWNAGQSEPARASLEQASRLTSDEETLLRIAETEGSYGDSVHERSTLLKIPLELRDFRWYAALGKIDSLLADNTAFERDFTKALSLTPKEAAAGILIALGDARWNRAEYHAALDSYQRALVTEGEKDLVHIYSQMADCNTHLGDLSRAIENYRSALNENPSREFREGLNLGLAQALIRLQRWPEALAVVRGVISEPDTSADGIRQAKALEALIGLKTKAQ
jgi:tetratricopeptide (TPR) repeat protein